MITHRLFATKDESHSLYHVIMSGFTRYQELLERLGKHKTGRSCLYINRLNDIDLKVLRRLVKESVAHVRRREKGQIG